MQTTTLGSNGPAVTSLGIGTWAWGDKLFWGYGKEYDATELHEAFKVALELGINFFDTAEIYGFGESERLLGQFMQQVNQPVQIATKYFPLPWRFTGHAVADALTHSLQRLQQSNVTLYQVHQPFDFFMGQKTLMHALAKEVKQGRIQAIGVSNYSAEQMRQAHHYLAEQGIPLAVNQMQYSLLHRKIETNGVLQAAQELGITILAYSPLAMGLLTGKYTPENYKPPVGARQIDPRFSKEGLEKLSPVIRSLQQIADQHGKTPSQVALNWLIAQESVIPIPGAKNADHVRQNAGALGWQLSKDEIQTLNDLTRSYR